MVVNRRFELVDETSPNFEAISYTTAGVCTKKFPRSSVSHKISKIKTISSYSIAS